MIYIYIYIYIYREREIAAYMYMAVSHVFRYRNLQEINSFTSPCYYEGPGTLNLMFM